MRCQRCSGLMVVEPFCDTSKLGIARESRSARCLNCGNVEDAVIVINRLEPRSATRGARHSMGVEMQRAW